MGKNKMILKAVYRIQPHSDRTGRNQGFKARAQRVATKNERK